MTRNFPPTCAARSTQQARALRSRRALHGDSLLEVMIALAVATIGIVGLASMQGATVRSNQDSQETTVAVSFAKTWLERIKRDALTWTAAAAPLVIQGNVMATRSATLPGTYFLPTAPAADTWSVPIPLYAGESAGANNRGVDVGALNVALPAQPIVTNNDIHYCVNTNFVVTQNSIDGLPEKMLATVRVWWTRRASLEQTDYRGIGVLVRASGCGAVIPSPADLASPEIRALYLSTPIRFTSPSP